MSLLTSSLEMTGDCAQGAFTIAQTYSICIANMTVVSDQRPNDRRLG